MKIIAHTPSRLEIGYPRHNFLEIAISVGITGCGLFCLSLGIGLMFSGRQAIECVHLKQDVHFEKPYFLANYHPQSCQIERENRRWLGSIFGIVLIFVGSSVIYALWQITVPTTAIFDRESDVLTIEKRSVYGKTAELNYRLSDLEEVWLAETDCGDIIEYSVNLKFNFQSDYSLTLFRTEQLSEAENIVTTIRQYC